MSDGPASKFWKFIIAAAGGVTAIAAAVGVIWFVISFFFPNSPLHTLYAEATGVKGLVRYEVGILDPEKHVGANTSLKPTSNGQLELLRHGAREIGDLKRNDLLKVMSKKPLRDTADCDPYADVPNCSEAAEITILESGACLRVTKNPKEDPQHSLIQADGKVHYTRVSAGWVEVVTSPCSFVE